MVKGSESNLYQIHSEIGIIKLDGSDEVIIPPSQTMYANDPRFNKSTTIHIGIQNKYSSTFGR